MTWSVSAGRTWSRCQRQYFFDHIMGHHAARDALRQRAFFLGQIQSFSLWQGKVVHAALEDWILPSVQTGRWPDPKQIVPQALELAEKQFRFSAERKFDAIKKKEAGSAFCILAPHYFRERIAPDGLDQCLSTIQSALINLLNSNGLRQFLIGRQWYKSERTMFFKVGETTVQAQPDLIMPFRNGSGLDIIDWKVALNSSNYSFQVGVYALAAQENETLRAYAKAGLRAYVINLLDSDPESALKEAYVVTEAETIRTANEIYESIERMQCLIGGRKYDELDIAWFDFANSVGSCALCYWRELCLELSDESPAKSLSNHQPKPAQLELPFG